jgi:hypothetical protein
MVQDMNNKQALDLIEQRKVLFAFYRKFQDGIVEIDETIKGLIKDTVLDIWVEFFQLKNSVGEDGFGCPGGQASVDIGLSNDGVEIEWSEYGPYQYYDSGYGTIPWDYVLDDKARENQKFEMLQIINNNNIKKHEKYIDKISKQIEELQKELDRRKKELI